MHLSLIHAMQDSSTKHEDTWNEISAESSENALAHRNDNWSEPRIHVRSELNKLCIACSPEGFFESVQTGHAAAVKLFIEAKVGTELRNKRGSTPLIAANDGYTALHQAAALGHLEIVKSLLAHSAAKHPRAIDQNTPCTLAAKNGQTEVLKLLDHPA